MGLSALSIAVQTYWAYSFHGYLLEDNLHTIKHTCFKWALYSLNFDSICSCVSPTTIKIENISPIVEGSLPLPIQSPTTDLLSVIINYSFLDFHINRITQHYSVVSGSFCSAYFRDFFFFNFWVVSHMDILQFVYPLTWMDSWVVPSFLLFLNKITVNVCVQVFVWTHVFIACGNIPKSVIAGLCGKCMFNF